MSVCKSCRAPIVWAVTPVGKRIPIDREPVMGGNIDLRVVATQEVAFVVEADTTVARHVSHFVTCPNADEHRRQR